MTIGHELLYCFFIPSEMGIDPDAVYLDPEDSNAAERKGKCLGRVSGECRNVVRETLGPRRTCVVVRQAGGWHTCAQVGGASSIMPMSTEFR